MKNKLVAGMVAGMFLIAQSYGQQLPAVYDTDALYREGLFLYQEQKYSAAQEKLERFIGKDVVSEQPRHTAFLADAQYYHAVCDFHLLRGDAEDHLQEFLAEHPTHSKANNAKYYLGKIFYIKRNFRKSVEYLASVDYTALEDDASQESRFMLGYSYFQIEKHDLAAETLQTLTLSNGEYRDKASYYYGIMQFKRKKYDEAYQALKSVDTTAEYHLKVPIYLTSILLEQDKFDQLDQYGSQLLQNKEPYEQKELIYKQIGLALFELKQYKRSIPYFEAHLESNTSPESGIFYRMGLANYQVKDYEPAVFYFSKVFSKGDSTAQVASYYSGFSYIELGKEEEARLAFKRSLEWKYNPTVRKDALLQYAKLSLENKYYNDALQSFKAYAQEYPESDNIKEIKALAGEALYFSSNFKDAIRLLEASGLQDKRAKQTYQKALYFHAVNLYSRNQPEDAIRFFAKAGDTDGGDAVLSLQSRFWMGEVNYALKKYDQAEDAYQKFLKTSGAKTNEYYPNVLVGLGWVTLVHSEQKTKEKYEEAKGYFLKAANLPKLKAEKPEIFVEAALRSADCHFALKEYGDAERWYQSVFDLKRNEADYALYQWATCKLRQSKYEVAIDKFKEIDEQFDRSEFKDKALLQISNTYLNWLSDHKNALRYAQKLVDEHPRSDLRAKAMLNCGFSAAQLDQKGEAITYFKSVLKEYGNQTEETQVALDELGSLLGTSEINDLLDQFKTQNPETKIKTDNILYKTGRDLYEIQNDPSGAVSQLTKYIQEYPNGTYYYEAHYVRGLANYDLRYPDKALADFAKVYDSKTAPDLASKAYSKTAVIFTDQKNYDKAIVFYQKAESIVENNIERVQIRMAMGEVHYKVKNYSDAKERFMQVALDPNTTEYSKGRAQVAWGRALYHLAKTDSAETLFRKVESENKNVFGAESQFWITQIAFDQKKYEDCKNAVFYMKDNYPTQNYWKAKSFILLAEVFRIEKDYFQAVETIKSVSEHSPDDEIKADATKRLEIFEKEANDPNMNPNGFETEEVELPNNDSQQEENEDLYDDSEYEAPKKEEKPAPKPVTNNVYKPVPKAPAKTESGEKKDIKTVIPKKEEAKKSESVKVIEKTEPKKEVKSTPSLKKEEPKPTSKPATKYEDKDLGRSEPVAKKDVKTDPVKPKTTEKVEPKKEIKPTPSPKKEEPKPTSKPATKYEDKDLGRSEPAVKKDTKSEPAKTKTTEKAEPKKEVKPTPTSKKEEPTKVTTKYEDKDLGRSQPAVKKEVKTEPAKSKSMEKAEPKKQVKPSPKKEEAKPINKSEAKTPTLAKKETESKEEIKSITYHLIVDQISGTKNAEVAAKKWKDKGFSGVMILQGSKDNEFRISIYYASSKDSAEKKKAELLKSQRIGTNAWVMSLTKK